MWLWLLIVLWGSSLAHRVLGIDDQSEPEHRPRYPWGDRPIPRRPGTAPLYQLMPPRDSSRPARNTLSPLPFSPESSVSGAVATDGSSQSVLTALSRTRTRTASESTPLQPSARSSSSHRDHSFSGSSPEGPQIEASAPGSGSNALDLKDDHGLENDLGSKGDLHFKGSSDHGSHNSKEEDGSQENSQSQINGPSQDSHPSQGNSLSQQSSEKGAKQSRSRRRRARTGQRAESRVSSTEKTDSKSHEEGDNALDPVAATFKKLSHEHHPEEDRLLGSMAPLKRLFAPGQLNRARHLSEKRKGAIIDSIYEPHHQVGDGVFMMLIAASGTSGRPFVRRESLAADARTCLNAKEHLVNYRLQVEGHAPTLKPERDLTPLEKMVIGFDRRSYPGQLYGMNSRGVHLYLWSKLLDQIIEQRLYSIANGANTPADEEEHDEHFWEDDKHPLSDTMIPVEWDDHAPSKDDLLKPLLDQAAEALVPLEYSFLPLHLRVYWRARHAVALSDSPLTRTFPPRTEHSNRQLGLWTKTGMELPTTHWLRGHEHQHYPVSAVREETGAYIRDSSQAFKSRE